MRRKQTRKKERLKEETISQEENKETAECGDGSLKVMNLLMRKKRIMRLCCKEEDVADPKHQHIVCQLETPKSLEPILRNSLH